MGIPLWLVPRPKSLKWGSLRSVSKRTTKTSRAPGWSSVAKGWEFEMPPDTGIPIDQTIYIPSSNIFLNATGWNTICIYIYIHFLFLRLNYTQTKLYSLRTLLWLHQLYWKLCSTILVKKGAFSWGFPHSTISQGSSHPQVASLPAQRDKRIHRFVFDLEVSNHSDSGSIVLNQL